jgi:nitrite reductase/ring-hydroxylating ferredoxin subunit
MNNIDAWNAVHSDVPDEPVVIPVEAYASQAYARAEGERLWSRVWQIACREEEIPKVGDYYTYEIMDESVIVTRTGPDQITAYYNVCPHRGRRLTAGSGHTARFHCRYHGWQWNLDGGCAKVLDREDWNGALTDEALQLRTVRVGRWAGFVFVNLDPQGESFEAFLGTLPYWLDPFEIGKMRYKWRQWLYFPCNWKVAIEAFIEGYHVGATHPQILRWTDAHTWSRAEGRHSCFGNTPRGGGPDDKPGITGMQVHESQDNRTAMADFMELLNTTVGLGTLTTQTIVDAARRAIDLLPKDATAEQTAAKMMELACQADAARGVVWPVIAADHFAKSGIDWHVFPNSIFLHGVTFILGYRARPHGDDPDSCIFEVYALERFPEGQEPRPENVYQPDTTEERWQVVLCQDFANMPEVQKGMKSKGFRGVMPNPRQEKPIINMHRNLAEFMGTGAPRAMVGE